MPSKACEKQHTKKYTSRPSPPYPANTCPAYETRQGNDGHLYIAVPDNRGVKRWQKRSPLRFRVKSYTSDRAPKELKAELLATRKEAYVMRPSGPTPRWLESYVDSATRTFEVHRPERKAFNQSLYIGDMDYTLEPTNPAARGLSTPRKAGKPRSVKTGK